MKTSFHHFWIGFFITILLGWQIGTAVELTIEGTQIEKYWRSNNKSLRGYWWKDTATDLIFGGLGILAGNQLPPQIKIFASKKEFKIMLSKGF